MEFYIGQIFLFAGNFAPRGSAFCNGQLLPINQNQALFSLLGTTYGGDGRTTFALPDLRGRVPMQQGNGAGLTPRTLGAKVGTETNTLSVGQLPAHNHAATTVAAAGNGTTNKADGNSLAHVGRTLDGSNALPNIYNSDAPSISMHANSVSVAQTGQGQAVNNMQPSLAINYCIALVGIFPSRS